MWFSKPCPTCQAYKEFLEMQRADMKEIVQKLNTLTEDQGAARDRLESIILRVTRLAPATEPAPTEEKKPLPVQRKTWDRTRARLSNELHENYWKDKIAAEEATIRELDKKEVAK